MERETQRDRETERVKDCYTSSRGTRETRVASVSELKLQKAFARN